MRKVLSIVVSAALATSGFPFLALAEEPTDATPAAPTSEFVVDPRSAMGLFERRGLFTNPNDPLRTYLFQDGGNGELTDMGKVMFRYLQADPPKANAADVAEPQVQSAEGEDEPPAADAPGTDPRVVGLQASLTALRGMGNATPEQLRAATAKIKELENHSFGLNADALEGDAARVAHSMRALHANAADGGPDPLMLSALLQAGFDGSTTGRPATAGAGSKFVQIKLEDGNVFMDKDGIAFKQTRNKLCRNRNWPTEKEPVVLNMKRYRELKAEREANNTWDQWICGEGNGTTIFSRELQRKQEEMNNPEGRPPGVPKVPENGRWNYEMLVYSAAKVQSSEVQLDRALLLDEMMQLANLLGVQAQEDQFQKDGQYNNALLEMLRKKGREKELNKVDTNCKDMVGEVRRRHGQQAAVDLGILVQKDVVDGSPVYYPDGHVQNTLQLVNCKLAYRRLYAGDVDKYIEQYQRRVHSYKGRSLITDEDVNRLQNREKLVNKYVTLLYVTSQDSAAAAQLESISHEFDRDTYQVVHKGGEPAGWFDWKFQLGWPPVVSTSDETPDSKMFRENLEAAPWDKERKENYLHQGMRLAQRLGRLRMVYDQIHGDLLDADHTGSGMSGLQAILGPLQTELNDVALDVGLYVTVPALAKMAEEEAGNFNLWLYGRTSLPGLVQSLTRAAANGLDRLGFGGEGGKRNFIGQYVDARNHIDKLVPALDKMSSMIAGGNFRAAREHLIDLDPENITKHLSMAYDRGLGLPTNQERIQAALTQAQKALQTVTRTHLYTGTIINLAAWSIGLGLAAPIIGGASTFLGKIGEGIGSKIMQGGAGLVKMAEKSNILIRGAARIGQIGIGTVGFTIRGGGVLLSHLGARMASLSPDPTRMAAKHFSVRRYIANSALRSGSAFLRIGGFASLAGGLGAGMQGVMYVYNDNFGDGHSPFKSVWHAMGESVLQGAHWATDSWHPLILFAGFSSKVYEGTFLEAATTSLANKGVVGNAIGLVGWTGRTGVRFGNWVGGTRLGKPLANLAKGLGEKQFVTNWVARPSAWMAKKGKGAGQWAMGTMPARILTSAPMQILDHVAKYHMASTLAGAFAEQMVYAGGVDVERDADGNVISTNIERQMKRATNAKNAALESPVWLLVPVGDAAAELAHAESMRAHQGYADYKASGQLFKLANAQDSQIMRMLRPQKVTAMEWIFNARLRGPRAGIGEFAAEPGLIRRARLEVLTETMAKEGASPVELLKIATGQRDAIGQLKPTEAVRDLAMELFAERITGPEIGLAKQFLFAKPGSRVGEYIADKGTMKAFAREILKTELPGRRRAPQELINSAEKILGPNAKSEIIALEAGAKMFEAFSKLGRASKQELAWAEGQKQKWEDWYAAQEKKTGRTNQSRSEATQEMLRALEADARAHLKGEMLDAAIEIKNFMEAVGERLNYNNRVDRATTQAREHIEALAHEFEVRGLNHGELSTLFKETLSSVERYQKTHAPDAPAEVTWQAQVVDNLASRVDAIVKTKGTSAIVKDIANRLADDVTGAVAIVRDVKGNNILMLREGQTRAIVNNYLTGMSEGSFSSTAMRQFMLAETGIGKTIIAYEGLLPYVMASAKAQGKTPMFLTVSDKLLAQARGDFRAMMKTRSTLEFDSYEGFKSKMAQGEKAENFWLLADEMDGAALQAALTLGEGAGTITRWTSEYNMLDTLGKRALSLLDQGTSALRSTLETRISEIRTAADRLPAGSKKQELMDLLSDLSQQSATLTRVHGRSFNQVFERGPLLQRTRGVLSNMLRGRGSGVSLGQKAIDAAASLRRAATRHRAANEGQLAERAETRAGRIERLANTLEELERAASPKTLRRKAGERRDMAADVPGELSRISDRLEEATRLRTKAAEIVEGERGMLPGEGNRGGEAKGLRDRATNIETKLRNRLQDLTGQEIPKGENLATHIEAARGRTAEIQTRLTTQARELDVRAKSAQKEASPELVERVNSELREVWKQENAAEITRAQSSMRETLLKQERILGEIRGGDKASVLEAMSGLRKTVGGSGGHARADRVFVKGTVKDMLFQERQILSASKHGGNKVRSKLARARLKQLREQINAEIKSGTPGWETRVRELLKVRERYMGEAVRKSNPAWETWREMKEFMEVHATNRGAMRSEYQRIEGAPTSAALELKTNAKRMRERARELPDSIRRDVERRASALEAEAQSFISDYVTKPKTAKEQQLLKNRNQALEKQAELARERAQLEADLRSAPESAQPALREQIKSVREKLTEIQTTQKSIEAQIVEFREAHIPELNTRLKRLKSESAEFLKSMESKLGRKAEGAELLTHLRQAQESWGVQIKDLNSSAEQVVAELHKRAVKKSRYFTWKLIRQVYADPYMPTSQKWDLIWDLAPGLAFPSIAIGPRQLYTSYVLTEMYNLASAVFDHGRQFRYDGILKKIIPVHNGEPSPTMDVPTKRAHEINSGTDLTLKYGEGKLETYVSITGNAKVEFIGFSGTEGAALKRHHGEHGVRSSGVKPQGIDHMPVEMVTSSKGRLAEIRAGVVRGIVNDFQSLSRLAEMAPDEVVAARDAGELPQPKSLLVVALSDTIGIRQTLANLKSSSFHITDTQLRARGIANPASDAFLALRNYGYNMRRGKVPARDSRGLRTGAMEDGWILTLQNKAHGKGQTNAHAKIFSGSEMLREARPQSNVSAQENTAAMREGTVKVVLIDSRIGGRGVDLPFKGNGKATGYRGYGKYEMQIHEPNFLSSPLKTQIEGRIGPGRIGSGKDPKFKMVLDISTAERDVMFQMMLRDEPVMRFLRDVGYSRGLPMEGWGEIHALVQRMRGNGRYDHVVRLYGETVEKYIKKQQAEVEEAELRSSQVSSQAGPPDFLRMHLLPVRMPFPAAK
jgi:hypothetical protein